MKTPKPKTGLCVKCKHPRVHHTTEGCQTPGCPCTEGKVVTPKDIKDACKHLPEERISNTVPSKVRVVCVRCDKRTGLYARTEDAWAAWLDATTTTK